MNISNPASGILVYDVLLSGHWARALSKRKTLIGEFGSISILLVTDHMDGIEAGSPEN